MKVLVGALLAALASMSVLAMDLYKCPGGTYANTTATRGPEELEGMGCTRLSLTSDPVSSSNAHELVVKRSPDGHFWLKGHINGVPLKFMVDTGATSVSVSEEFASLANLRGGRSIVVTTASGKARARLIEGVSVTASIFTVPKVNVSVGLAGLERDEALLGQSFLSMFEVTMDERQMIIRNKKR